MNCEISKSLLQSFFTFAILLIFLLIAAVDWFSTNQKIPIFEPELVECVNPCQGSLSSKDNVRTQFHALSRSVDNFRNRFLAVLWENQTPHDGKVTDNSQSNRSSPRITKDRLQEMLERERFA